MGGADRRGEAGFGAQRIAAGDEGEIVGAAAQLVDEIGDQIVEPAGFADQADQRLACHGSWRGEDRGFDAQHPFAPAGGRRQVGELDVEDSSLSSPAAARRGAHRPYSRNAGRPVSSRAAPSATSRSNRRRAARSVIGAWRAASAGETQSSASSRSTILDAGLARSLGATAIRVLERRERSAARSRAEAAASAIAPAAAFDQAGSPGLGRPPPSDLRARVQNFRRDQRQGPRPAQPDGDGEVEHPKGEDFGFGGWGVREGGEHQSGGLARLPRPDRPPLRNAFRLDARPLGSGRARSSRAAAWRAGRRRGRAGGRRGRATAAAALPQAQLLADGEAQVAQRAFVGVEAEDLGGGGGALQRQAVAQRPGGGRVAAQDTRRAKRGRRRRRTADPPPLPFRLPAPRMGPAPAEETPAVPALSPRFASPRVLPQRRRTAVTGVVGKVGEQVKVGANHGGMVNRWRRFVTDICGLSAPLVVVVAMSDKVALSDLMLFIVSHARFEPANVRKRPQEARRAA